jgi:hypothetical protein
MSAARSMWRRLKRSRSGVAMTEFALSLPLLLTAGLWGLETANLAVTHMRVSQLAIHLADNASRVGDVSTLENRKIYESDINDLLLGASIQAGGLEFFKHGRAVISSLEVVPETEDQQYIHWQRCLGRREFDSSYGPEGTGLAGDLPGMGPAGAQVTATEGMAVIFVEVQYEYQALVSEMFVRNRTVEAIASFVVRDDRDLTQIYQRNPAGPDPVARCTMYTETV